MIRVFLASQNVAINSDGIPGQRPRPWGGGNWEWGAGGVVVVVVCRDVALKTRRMKIQGFKIVILSLLMPLV